MEHRVKSSDDFQQVIAAMHGTSFPFRVSILKGEDRRAEQNNLLHMWFDEIAKHYGDRTLIDAKRDCHRMFGVPIRSKKKMFAYLWENATKDLSPEFMDRVLIEGPFHISSGMTVGECNEYLNEIENYYRPLGVALTSPEDQK